MKLINLRYLIQRSSGVKSTLKSFLYPKARCGHNSARSVTTTTDVDMVHHKRNAKDHRMVWIDLEMTGLEVESDQILEIACLITEEDLTLVAEGPNIVIHQSDAVLDGMHEWCIQHHGESGLTEASKNSKINLLEAEDLVVQFVQQHTPKGKCPIAGNSVGTDRQFLSKYMPKLAEHLHYRIIDVSTVKELCRRWYPIEFKGAPAKKLGHRAMDDIKESIEELRYYRQGIFK